MVKNFFKNNFLNSINEEKTNDNDEKIINVITLLIEASSIDDKIDNVEVNKILEIISKKFQLDELTIKNYYEKAMLIQKDNSSFHNLTSKINRDFDYSEKISILEMLWQVVLVDEIEHDFESNLMRRVCGLLNISDIDNGNVKKKVLNKNKLI